jgi:hypothetical protein
MFRMIASDVSDFLNLIGEEKIGTLLNVYCCKEQLDKKHVRT